MDEQREICAVFDALARLAIARDLHPLSRYTSPLHLRISDGWEAWVNGANESAKIVDVDMVHMAREMNVPAFSAAIFWNGWLAGLVDPYGGTLPAGEAANEDTLLEALEIAIEEARGDG